jgi:LytS/YehU family sensor histidine kinase
MRLILENSREESITLEKEIRTLTYYLQLQKLRYEDKFDYVLDVDKDVDPENVWLPPMLAQPVIENAIEHGIKHLENRMGQINISFTRKGQTLLLEVRDNGVGFGESANKKPKGVAHRSLSATITSERLAILNKGKTEKVNMTIEELKDSFGTVLGTSVLFHIPYKES